MGPLAYKKVGNKQERPVMKNRSLVIFILFIIVLASNFLSYHFGYSRKMSMMTSTEELLFKDDYPLIEVMFDKKYTWTLVVREHHRTGDETFRIITRLDALEFNREHLSVSTFPVGRGTTPTGCLYLYKDRTLIKEIPFVDITISNKHQEKEFTSVSYSEVKKIINDDLPPLY
jgi:hypothetical protein